MEPESKRWTYAAHRKRLPIASYNHDRFEWTMHLTPWTHTEHVFGGIMPFPSGSLVDFSVAVVDDDTYNSATLCAAMSQTHAHKICGRVDRQDQKEMVRVSDGRRVGLCACE